MRNHLRALCAVLLLAACSNEHAVPLAEPIALFATHERAGGDTTEIQLDGDDTFHIRSIPDLTLTNVLAIDYSHTMRAVHSSTGMVWMSNRTVTVQMAAQDASRFAALTRVLDGRRLAIRWGDDVIGAPVIRSVIERGNLQVGIASNNAATIDVHMARQKAGPKVP